jgi:hypothetical protein
MKKANPVVKESAKDTNKSLWQRIRTVVLLTIVGVLITIAQTAWWINHTIYDTEAFSDITTTALTAESSRVAIANEIVSQSFANKPVLQATLGKSATKLIASLLETDQATNAIEKVTTKVQTILTSEKREAVTFNLVPLKKGLVVISAIAERADKPIEVDASEIPDTITLIKGNETPKLYKINQTLLFLAPISIFASIGLLGYLLYSGRKRIYKVLLQIGIMLVAIAAIGFSTGPLIRPPVLSLVNNANARIILGNLYDGFIAPFNAQMATMGAVGILVIIFAAIQLGAIGTIVRKFKHSK